jgi:hypothetical protein
MDLLSPEQLSEGKEEPKKYGMSADDLGAMRAEFQKLKSIPLWTVWKHLLRQAWSRGFDIDELLWLPWTCTPIEHTSSPIPRLRLGKREFRLAPQWQFQDAVLGLAFQSWRAHFCAHCGEPFVADARQNKYCGVKCQGEATAAANLGRKMRYYDKNRKRINAKRRRKHRQSMAHKNIQTAERRRT